MKLRKIDDVDEHKRWIHDNILAGFKDKEYLGKTIKIRIKDPYIKANDFSLAEQKKALLTNKNLNDMVYGTIQMVDKETGDLIDEKKDYLLARFPYHTGRNAIIANGASYTVPANQLRLRPGAFTRKKENGEIETHFNLVSGTGSGFRIHIDPNTGIFNLKLKNTNAPLYPFLKAMGVPDKDMETAWGQKVFEINQQKKASIDKFYSSLVPFGNPNEENKTQAIVTTLQKARMDGEVNRHTLGYPYDTLTPTAIIDATKKILDISKGKAKEDDRDSLLYKKVFSAEDFYKEKIQKDAGSLGKKLAYKLDRTRSFEKLLPGYFSKQLWGVVKSDPSVSPVGTLSQPSEEINPIDMYDQHHKVTLMGEGGIGNIREVTMSARNVHPSEYGFIDFIRTPESFNVGIEKRLAQGTRKGDDNLLYKEFVNAKTGKKEFLNPLQAYEKVIAFPGEMASKKKLVAVLHQGKQKEVEKKEVDYYLATVFDQFSVYDNLVPMSPGVQGNRMLLAGKALALTLPIKDGEAPHVQVKNPHTGKAWEKDLADIVLNKTAKIDGTITKITPDDIFIKPAGKSTLVRHGLYNYFPLNLKTFIHQTPLVKVGDKVSKGDMLAHSNFSDKEGTMSMGKNLTSAFIPFKGWNFEDGIVLSNSGSKKLTSEQMYTYEYDLDDPEGKIVNKNKYVSMFPSLYPKEILDRYDDEGVIKVGAKINYEEPVILAAEKRPPSARDIQLGNLHRSLKNSFRDASIPWHHSTEGIVTDVSKTTKGIKVLIKTETPAQVGDKLTGRYGNKGVVSLILPDDQMPKVKKDGKPVDILLNVVGIPSRINPVQVHEHLLGKIVKETKREPYIIAPGIEDGDLDEMVDKELKKYKVSKTEDLVYNGRTIPDVSVGESYIWKLSKMSEGELRKREIGGYDMDEQPIKGKSEQGQALRIGQMEVNALIGHGAKENLRDVSIKGQRNDDFFRRLKLGLPLSTPKVPFVYNKFLAMLRGAGINTEKEGNDIKLLPLIDKEILRSSNGEIQNPETLYTKNLNPVTGGLFDPGITGGLYGNQWAHIKLAEPMPNPVMEDVVKKVLRLNQKEYEKELTEGNIPKRLSELDINSEIDASNKLVETLYGTKRDSEYKRLGFLQRLKENGLEIKDLILKNIPVIPPIFRPISVVGTKETIQIGNPNYLYKDLMTANKSLSELKPELTDLRQERMNLYRSMKAVTGIGEPVNLQTKGKGVTGFIESIVGDQPKTGYFQKKVLSKTQDFVTRGVVSPNPTLGLDSLAIPEDSAWAVYKDVVSRRMIQNGVPAVLARKELEERSPRARKYLEDEMKERPIAMNRNPSLHKFNIMAFYPKITQENTIQVPPQIVTGFGMDFDGDQANLFLPITPEAVKEAKDILLPSKNLLHIKDRKVHYLPSQGTVLGLYTLTQPAESKKIKKQYRSIDDLRNDYNAGLIKVNDLVELSV